MMTDNNDNNAPSIHDYSQSFRHTNYAEVLKLNPRNGNKVSGYPGAVSGEQKSSVQMGCCPLVTNETHSNKAPSNGCCNEGFQSDINESFTFLADAAYPEPSRRKKYAEVTKLSSPGAVSGDVYSQVFHSARAHGNCEAVGAIFGEKQLFQGKNVFL